MNAVYRYPDGAVAVELDSGVLHVVRPDGATDERLSPHGHECELLDPDDSVTAVLDRVLRALAPIKMSAKARKEVEAALDDLGSGCES